MKKFPVAQNKTSRSTERGNVLIIILIGIMLFAALGFAVSNIMRSGDPRIINEQRARLLTNDILGYARSMRFAIQDMKISNGCDDTEISFTREAGDVYEHGTPVEDKCKVFHPDGGSMSYVAAAPDANDGSEWLFTGRYRIPGIGTGSEAYSGAGPTTEQELLIILPGITDTICSEINEEAGISTLPVDDALTQTPFDGTYISVFGDAALANLSNPPLNLRKPYGCVSINNAQNVFYQVLIAR